MIVMGISMILFVSILLGYDQMVRYERNTARRMLENQGQGIVDARLSQLLGKAYLSKAIDDRLTYFLSNPSDSENTTTDTITFTTIGVNPPGGFLRTANDQTFEELHEIYGPQGGVSEVSLSAVPVGESASGNGLFMRIQTPADGDPTQGGMESLLIEGATNIQFLFWDGTSWVNTWDTLAQSRRLPAAVKLIYRMPEEEVDREQTFALMQSDITADDPLTIETGGQ